MTAFLLTMAVLLLLACAAVLGVLIMLAVDAARGRRASGAREGPGESDGGDDGGSQPRVPPHLPPGPPDTAEPEWWPEFERELAAYMRETRTSA